MARLDGSYYFIFPEFIEILKDEKGHETQKAVQNLKKLEKYLKKQKKTTKK